MKPYYFAKPLNNISKPKKGKEFLLEKLLGKLDAASDFYSLMSRMEYKSPNSFINFLKKNEKIVGKNLLERITIEYGTCVSGQGDSNKLERFKLLLKYYSLTEDYDALMEKLNYSKSGNFQHFIYFALCSKYDGLKESNPDKDYREIAGRVFEEFNISNEAKGLHNLTKDLGYVFSLWHEDGKVNFQYFINQLNYAKKAGHAPYITPKFAQDSISKDKIILELLGAAGDKPDFFKLMPLAFCEYSFGFEKLLKRTALNHPETKELADYLLKQANNYLS